MIVATWPVCRSGMDGMSLVDIGLRLLRYLAAVTEPCAGICRACVGEMRSARYGAAAAFASAPLVPDPNEAATCESIISPTYASPIAQAQQRLRFIQYQWYANEHLATLLHEA